MRYAIIGATAEQVKRVGGTDIKEARSTGIIFAALTEAQAAQLKAMGCQVTPVGGVKAMIMPPIVAPPTPIAGIPTYRAEDLVLTIGVEDLRHITEPPLYGSGMNLAIIGSGIRETHKRINGHVIYRKNYTQDLMRDGFDHDTGVCDIALTVAPECNILNLKVLNERGEGTEEDVAIAIDDCISFQDTNPDIAPSVINLSLGGPDDGNLDNPLRVACRVAIDRGIWVVASAGNGGPVNYSITSPACERYVVAVGSISYDPFQISTFSSRGPTMEGLVKPDGVLFGENMEMASSDSDTAMIAKSGTSFATPFGSGMAILFHEGMQRQAVPTIPLAGVYPEMGIWVPVDMFIDRFLPGICIKPEGTPQGKDYEYGYGLPFGPLIYKAITAVPVMETVLGAIPPLLGIAMLGMVMAPMAKEFSHV